MSSACIKIIGCFSACDAVSIRPEKREEGEPKADIGISTKNDHLKINFKPRSAIVHIERLRWREIEIVTRLDCEAIRYE